MFTKLSVIALMVVGLVGCSSTKSPDITAKIHDSLTKAGLNNVSVTEDTEQAVLTLNGTVKREGQKGQAEEIAKAWVPKEAIANQIQVVSPAGDSASAAALSSEIDRTIQANLDTALQQANLAEVHHSTSEGVVTLLGDLHSPSQRADAERISASVPNVQRVVNEINVIQGGDMTSSADRSK
jgi:osmotically-inducible protein OsmY